MTDKQNEIKLDNIAAIYTDEERLQRYIFTRDILINQLQNICPDINKSFDKTFEEEFRSLSSDLSEILPLLFVGKKQALKENNQLFIICGDLLTNAGNTIIAATQTLRCGFRMQSGILLRSVIEICATVMHLIIEPDKLNDFLNDKVKSTKSISVAEKQVPLFGRIWGLLSEKQIHINTLHADKYPMQVYEDKSEIPASVTIGMLGITTLILSIVTELTFVNEIKSPKHWEILGKGMVKFIPPDAEKLKWTEEIFKRNKDNT